MNEPSKKIEHEMEILIFLVHTDRHIKVSKMVIKNNKKMG